MQFQHGSLDNRLEREAPPFRVLVHQTLRDDGGNKSINKRQRSQQCRRRRKRDAYNVDRKFTHQKVVPAHILPLVHRFFSREHVRTVGELFQERGLAASHVAFDEYRVGRRSAVVVYGHGYERLLLRHFGQRRPFGGTTYVRRRQ